MSFNRETRYLVLKIKEVNEVATHNEMESLKGLMQAIETSRASIGKGPLDVVVLESDWPEYEPTWKAIEDRMNGTKPKNHDVEALEWIHNRVEGAKEKCRMMATKSRVDSGLLADIIMDLVNVSGHIDKIKNYSARPDMGAVVEEKPKDPVCRNCGLRLSRHESRSTRCPRGPAGRFTNFEVPHE